MDMKMDEKMRCRLFQKLQIQKCVISRKYYNVDEESND